MFGGDERRVVGRVAARLADRSWPAGPSRPWSLVAVALRDRRRAALVVPLALFAVAALPWYAFFEGHPFRIRYMVPLVAAAIAALASAWGCCRGACSR